MDQEFLNTITRGRKCAELRTKKEFCNTITRTKSKQVIEWILQNQLGRRNLTDFQKNEIALRYEDVIAKRMKERQSEYYGNQYSKVDLGPNGQKSKIEHTTRRAELAKIAGTSQGSIQRSKLILEKGTQEHEPRVNKEKMENLNMGKYHQSKYEQEVTIGFNAAEGTAEIYTADPVWIRKMDKLVQQNPEQFRPGRVETYQGEIVAKRYTFPKRLISIRSKERRLTEEQRAELAARFNRGQQDGV